jgi:Cys-tRNA(Pro)/Cys-tRNA(Cys) deacylase
MEERIVALLTGHGVRFRVHEHGVAPTVAEAAARLPFPVEQFLKTVAFRVKDGPWLLAASRGGDRIDYRKLAAAAGVKRGALRQPGAGEVEAALGFVRGGVGPFPPDGDTLVLVDERALELETVYCGIGRADRTLEIGLRDLIRVVGGRVLPLVQEGPDG